LIELLLIKKIKIKIKLKMQENKAGERVREDGSDEQTKNIDCI